MKSLKFILIIIAVVICALFLLSGCRDSAEEEEKRIVNWLDNTYGKDSYTMTKDPEHKRYFYVTLKEYPGLKFSATIAYDVKVGSSYLWANDNEVFARYAIKEFQKSHDMGTDSIVYDESIHYVYSAEATSLKQLKVSYDRMINFITYVSEKYPVIVDAGALDMRMDVKGIRLKGRDDSDKWIYLDICEVKDKKLQIKPYKEIYNELKPMLMTHPENPNGLCFHANIGRSIILGSDTFDDCLYKNVALNNPANASRENLKKIILQPGELSSPYTFRSEGDYDLTEITVKAKNLSGSPCSLLDATIVYAYISIGREDTMYIEPAWVQLKENPQKEWINPYKALGVSPPKTEKEKKEGVKLLNKHAKVLFYMSRYDNSVGGVELTFQE